MSKQNKRQIVGWIAVVVSTCVTCIWAFWGIIENFHEGWYFQSWIANVGLMFVQYLSPFLIFFIVTLISIFWPRIGGVSHMVFALAAIWFFNAFSNAAVFLLIIPFIGLGFLYWFGRPEPRKLAAGIVIGLPILTLVISGSFPAYRVSQRIFDGNLSARTIQGFGVDLIWAPEGPGWPQSGEDWFVAQANCRHLKADGVTLADAPLDIWRLPTVDEVVRSMSLHGQNSKGVWNAEKAEAVYETKPDKESPLWNPYSQVIYWWTATEIDENRAYMIVYDGRVWPRSKQLDLAYMGYRCVK